MIIRAPKKLALIAIHRLLMFLFGNRPGVRSPLPTPKRVLLVNPTHIGDIVISTSLLPVLKAAYPGVEIGFTVGSWALGVVVKHPLVTYTHVVDHWRMNRNEATLLRKTLRYLKTRSRAVREIRSLKYDVSICLHPGKLDLLDLCWQADIPSRLAFSDSLWAPLATMLAEYPKDDYYFKHHGDCQAALLLHLGVAPDKLKLRRSSLVPSSSAAVAELRRLLGLDDSAELQRYCIIHMSSGAAFREMPVSFWRELASGLTRDTSVIFTGKGSREAQLAEMAMSGLPNCYNASDQLSWQGFVAAVQYADVVYGVESMACHVAAAVGTKAIAIYTGAAGVGRWRPYGQNTTVWTNAVPCSPCHLQNGCEKMLCTSGIKPSQILSAATPLTHDRVTTTA